MVAGGYLNRDRHGLRQILFRSPGFDRLSSEVGESEPSAHHNPSRVGRRSGPAAHWLTCFLGAFQRTLAMFCSLAYVALASGETPISLVLFVRTLVPGTLNHRYLDGSKLLEKPVPHRS